jgi:hypothetical protein
MKNSNLVMALTLALFSATLMLGARASARVDGAMTYDAKAQLSEFRTFGFKSAEDMEKYLTPGVITTVEVDPATLPAPLSNPLLLDGSSIADLVIGDLSSPQTWVAIGQKIWDIVKANKPVVNVTTDKISILPEAQGSWANMENWQGPATKAYTLQFKNLLGMSVVTYTYRVAYNYGGTLAGKGQFIANLTVIPQKVDVLWGYTLNAHVEHSQVINTGTRENPVPSVQTEVKWAVDTVVRHTDGTDSYNVKGNGEMTKLTE